MFSLALATVGFSVIFFTVSSAVHQSFSLCQVCMDMVFSSLILTSSSSIKPGCCDSKEGKLLSSFERFNSSSALPGCRVKTNMTLYFDVLFMSEIMNEFADECGSACFF